MKKILSIILLLCIVGTTAAQQKQGYLVIQTTDGTTLALKDSDIDRIVYGVQAPVFTKMWYVIGYDVANGNWNFDVPNGCLPMYVKDAQQGELSYTGYFTGQGFKLSTVGWVNQWGCYGFGYYVMDDVAADMICVPTPGYYRIVFNTRYNTLTIEQQYGNNNYGDISLSGTFNDWGDTALQRVPSVNGESHDWYANVTFSEDGEAKFKANHSWDTNWGGTEFPSGVGQYNSVENIPVTAGTYVVLFNDLTGQYRFYDPVNPEPIVEEQTFNVTVEPGETYIDFETYEKPGIALFSHLEIPLVTSYTLNSVNIRLSSGNNNYNLPFSVDADGNYTVTTNDLKNAVKRLCGNAREERQLTIDIDALVNVKGFNEHYVASTTITCLMPPSEWMPFVYFIGATNGWSEPDQKLASPNMDGVYKGFCYLADPNGWGLEFKFMRRAGDWADDSQLNSNNILKVSGDFQKGSDNFIATAGEGVYYIVVDLVGNTITGTKVESMSIIGDFTGWTNDVDMTWDVERYCFTATGVGATSAGWKFRINHDWTVNLGGKSSDNLVYDGENIYLEANKVELFPTRRDSDNIYCVVE